jgi:hypothetical protein
VLSEIPTSIGQPRLVTEVRCWSEREFALPDGLERRPRRFTSLHLNSAFRLASQTGSQTVGRLLPY